MRNVLIIAACVVALAISASPADAEYDRCSRHIGSSGGDVSIDGPASYLLCKAAMGTGKVIQAEIESRGSVRILQRTQREIDGTRGQVCVRTSDGDIECGDPVQ